MKIISILFTFTLVACNSFFDNKKIDENNSIKKVLTLETITKAIKKEKAFSFCDRTPAIQQSIITKMGVLDCKIITKEDLLKITSLDLKEKKLTSLKVGDFAYLNNLSELDLSKNQLRNLEEGIFDGLTNLNKLKLSFNELETLPAGVFDELTSLEHLNFTQNKLHSLPAGVFNKLKSLKTLYLSINQLKTLPAGVFDELKKLESVYLNRNAFSEEYKKELKTYINSTIKLKYEPSI